MLQTLAPAWVDLLYVFLIQNDRCGNMEEVFVFEYTEETHLGKQLRSG